MSWDAFACLLYIPSVAMHCSGYTLYFHSLNHVPFSVTYHITWLGESNWLLIVFLFHQPTCTSWFAVPVTLWHINTLCSKINGVLITHTGFLYLVTKSFYCCCFSGMNAEGLLLLSFMHIVYSCIDFVICCGKHSFGICLCRSLLTFTDI